MKKALIAIIAIAAIVAVGYFVVYPMLMDDKFDHSGKIAEGDAADFQPDIGKFPNGFVARDISDFSWMLPPSMTPSVSGYDSFSKILYTDDIPVSPAASVTRYVIVEILVFENVADAKNAVETFPGSPSSNHGTFEWCFKSSTGSAYIFSDMNVVGFVAMFNSISDSAINAVLLDIETKIHNAAVKI